MNHSEFETVIRDAMERLPDWVREALHNIDVQVAEEADEHLDPEGEGLLGLYVGLPLTERDANHAGELPDVIYIFRRPHLELALPPDELREEIVKTLIHEIAHYFGIDDDHLDSIGWG
jgi:predicted Zn-dependent protease with MMP-like domain